MSDKTYLGDGVYADFDGFHVVLTTDGNIICLDSSVMRSLLDYIGKVHGMKITAVTVERKDESFTDLE